MYKCEYGWQKLGGVHLHYMKHGKHSLETAKQVFVILPGNPGSMYFYDTFAYVLNKKTGVPVWGISHTGHVSVSRNMDKMGSIKHPVDHQCDLQNQIKHKIDFLEKIVCPNVEKVYLIGHSIGCYIALQAMHEMQSEKLKKAILLFPTIENMGITENGKTAVLISPMQCTVWYIGWFLQFLPAFMKRWIAKYFVKVRIVFHY